MELLTLIFLAVVVGLVLDTIYLNMGTRISFRLPLVGDLFLVMSHFNDFHDFAVTKYSSRGTKPLVFILGRIRFWGVVHPKDVEHMLKTNWKNFPISVGLRGEALADLMGDGIFHADGECWYTQRKTVSREFTLNNFKNFMLVEFVRYAHQLRDKLEEACTSSAKVDMHAEFFKLTLDSFGKIGFGIDLGGLKGNPVPFAKAFDDAQELSARRVATKPPFVWKLQRTLNLGSEVQMKKDLKIINDFVADLVKSREAEKDMEEKNDLFSRLMTISEGEEDPAKRVKYLRDMCVNFMIAGRDTTACAMSWLVWELYQNPKAEAKLVEELEDAIPTDHPTFEELANCHYLAAVIHETLRLHPSVPFDIKHVEADDVLPSNGEKISAGDSIAYIPYSMARLPEIWGPDAAKFVPERWLNSSGDFQKEDLFKYPVFQAGPRLCLGVEMALLEMKSVIASLYKQFKFEVTNVPQYRTGLVLQMTAEGLQTKVTKRK